MKDSLIEWYKRWAPRIVVWGESAAVQVTFAAKKILAWGRQLAHVSLVVLKWLAVWTAAGYRRLARWSSRFDAAVVIGDKKLAILLRRFSCWALVWAVKAARGSAFYISVGARYLVVALKYVARQTAVATRSTIKAVVSAAKFLAAICVSLAGLMATAAHAFGHWLADRSERVDKLIAVADGHLLVAMKQLYQYAIVARLNKPIGIFLLGWPALWALWLAKGGIPDLNILLIFIAGIVVMRSAGCVINDYADRNIDPHIERTRDRPIAAGRVGSREALLVFVLLILVAFNLVLELNLLTIYLSFAAAASAATYPFMKRFTYLPQAFLGIAFGWAIPMAWAAQTNTIPQESWLLFIVVVLWAMAYDTMYAMADRQDDIKVGVKSTAILFGEADRLIIGFIQLSVLVGLLMLGGRLSMEWPYYVGLGLASCFSLYQQYLIRQRHPKACFQAFLNNNWFGAAVFAGIVTHYFFINYPDHWIQHYIR